MGEQRHPGQSGSPSSNPDTIAKPNAIANPDAEANADTDTATNAVAHPIADSNTIPASYAVTHGLTNAGTNRSTLADPCPSAGARGKPHGSPTRATSGCRRPQRGRPAVYGRRAGWISSGGSDRAHPARHSYSGRLGNPGRFAESLPAFHAGDHGDPRPADDDAPRHRFDAALTLAAVMRQLVALLDRACEDTLDEVAL